MPLAYLDPQVRPKLSPCRIFPTSPSYPNLQPVHGKEAGCTIMLGVHRHNQTCSKRKLRRDPRYDHHILSRKISRLLRGRIIRAEWSCRQDRHIIDNNGKGTDSDLHQGHPHPVVCIRDPSSRRSWTSRPTVRHRDRCKMGRTTSAMGGMKWITYRMCGVWSSFERK